MQVEIKSEKVTIIKKKVTIEKSTIVPTWVTGPRTCVKCGYRVDEGGLSDPETAVVAKIKGENRNLHFHNDCFLKCNSI
jgi:hypothetical protein